MRFILGAGRRVLHLELRRDGVEWSLGHWADDVEDGERVGLDGDAGRDDSGDDLGVGFRGGVVV